MDDDVIDKERDEPPEPAPVQIGALRYQALPWGQARGLGQNGGLLAAIDVATGQELWVLKVYQIDYDADLEGDKQDHFIASMRALDEHTLELETERGRRFHVDLQQRQARRVDGEDA